jgi:hypothetical protein
MIRRKRYESKILDSKKRTFPEVFRKYLYNSKSPEEIDGSDALACMEAYIFRQGLLRWAEARTRPPLADNISLIIDKHHQNPNPSPPKAIGNPSLPTQDEALTGTSLINWSQ